MRKILSILLVFVIMTVLCENICYASEVVTSDKGNSEQLNITGIGSDAVLVLDVSTGYSIYEKDIYTSYYPASVTKIMTAMIVLDNCEMDETVTFSHDAVFSIPSGYSSAYADEGEELSVEQCLYGLMLVSANDVANGLAEHIAGTNEMFADMMNERAEALGCVNTHFVNPHGLDDEEHYTCAYDLATIGYTAYKEYETYRDLIGTYRYVVPPTNKQEETRYWHNSNKLFDEESQFYYEYCLGGKSGYTDIAGSTLVTYANINGRIIMVATLHARNATEVYTDHNIIYDYIKNNVSEEYFDNLDKLYEENKPVDENPKTDAKPGDDAGQKNNDTNNSEENESSIFSIVLRVVLIIFGVLLLLYTVLRIRVEIIRYKKRKRRREKMRRKREMQRRRYGRIETMPYRRQNND